MNGPKNRKLDDEGKQSGGSKKKKQKRVAAWWDGCKYRCPRCPTEFSDSAAVRLHVECVHGDAQFDRSAVLAKRDLDYILESCRLRAFGSTPS